MLVRMQLIRVCSYREAHCRVLLRFIGCLAELMYLVLVAIAWVYVVLLMAMTEQSFIAGIMTFVLYCVFPLSIILYLMGTPGRKRRRQSAEDSQRASADNAAKADEKPADPSLL